LAWLAGVPLSYWLTKILIANVPFNEVIPFKYSFVAPFVGLLGMIVVTVLATFYPALSAAKRTVSDILRYG
jgi:ABC-type lipoprotein release transport system permease subunit